MFPQQPLSAGLYELISGYVNSNYKADSEMSTGRCRIEGGKTTVMAMGAMAIDTGIQLEKPASSGVVVYSA